MKGPINASRRILARFNSRKAFCRRMKRSPNRLYAFITRMPNRYSSIRLPAFILAWICFLLKEICIRLLKISTNTANGKAMNMARDIRQSIHRRPKKASIGMTSAPINCGRWCEIPVSAMVKSVIIMDDKSPGSCRLKNPNESLRRCSARLMRPSALSS